MKAAPASSATTARAATTPPAHRAESVAALAALDLGARHEVDARDAAESAYRGAVRRPSASPLRARGRRWRRGSDPTSGPRAATFVSPTLRDAPSELDTASAMLADQGVGRRPGRCGARAAQQNAGDGLIGRTGRRRTRACCASRPTRSPIGRSRHAGSGRTAARAAERDRRAGGSPGGTVSRISSMTGAGACSASRRSCARSRARTAAVDDVDRDDAHEPRHAVVAARRHSSCGRRGAARRRSRRARPRVARPARGRTARGRRRRPSASPSRACR